jgi:Ni,Fe-hydrogenase I large subunit
MPTQAPEPTTKVFLPVVEGAPAPAPSQKLVIDPITRIEGHLRIEVKIENGHVADAWSAGMMFRGIELLMPGRDPRDAWVYTQRICGV